MIKNFVYITLFNTLFITFCTFTQNAGSDDGLRPTALTHVNAHWKRFEKYNFGIHVLCVDVDGTGSEVGFAIFSYTFANI